MSTDTKSRTVPGSLAAARVYLREARACYAAGQEAQAHLSLDLASIELGTDPDDGGFLLCCNAWEEPEEYETYAEAVSGLNAYLRHLEAEGWTVERGWASQDNLSAAKASKAIDSSTPNAFRFVQVVKDDA